jgi:hypothetical protein
MVNMHIIIIQDVMTCSLVKVTTTSEEPVEDKFSRFLGNVGNFKHKLHCFLCIRFTLLRSFSP